MDKPYADYAYYTGSYFGSSIPEASWPEWSRKASMRVEYLTFGRTGKLSASVLPDAVFDAVCCAAEVMYEYDKRKQARAAATKNGALKSESNDGYSVSYGGTDIEDEMKATAACDAETDKSIGEYLAHTGLMFKGWSHKWDEVTT